MAYNSSTVASSIANPLMQMFGTNSGIDQRISGSTAIYVNNAFKNAGSTATYQEGRAFGGNFWAYWTTDNSTTVASTGYFSDAGILGVRPGDVIMVVACSSTGSSGAGVQVLRFMTVANISTAGAASMASTASGQLYGTT